MDLDAQMQKGDLKKKLSTLELWSLLTIYRKSYIGFSKNPLLWTPAQRKRASRAGARDLEAPQTQLVRPFPPSLFPSPPLPLEVGSLRSRPP